MRETVFVRLSPGGQLDSSYWTSYNVIRQIGWLE